ncbi:MAG: phytanoyl-CoA dioxygenase family protein [Alphaproteobacteria bacterium]
MTPDKVLAHAPKVLDQSEREAFYENGYLLKERFVSEAWLARLREVTERMIDESRKFSTSDDKFDLEEAHTAAAPKLRRLTQPVEHDPVYWEFASNSMITDLAEDLLGPNVKFHHSKLNFKWFGGGEEVKWHQDIQFWPHTNFSVLTIGVYLDDVDDETGPMGIVPGSHKGELFDQYNSDDQWVGCVSDNDLKKIALENAVYLKGPAGSITVHHCRTLHGSLSNNHETKSRPLLLNAFSAADALPITPNPTPSRYNGTIVRGEAARHAEFEPFPARLPPDWSGGYSSIFALQQKEENQAPGG